MQRHWLAQLLMFLLFMICIGPQTAISKESALGRIDKIEGTVTITRSDGQEVQGEVGLSLAAGDQIATGEGSRVSFSLLEGSSFRLGEKTQVSVDELSNSDEEDDQPMLRLALGYLWSKLQKVKGSSGKINVVTPTAIVGVRGTEFETVVSLDASSAIVVDEGTLEVSSDEDKVIVDKGKMTEVEFAKKPTPPVASIAKEQRDWSAWRRKRVERLYNNLPQLAPKFKNRFERAVVRSRRFTARVNEKADEIKKTIEENRQARRERDRQRFMQSRDKLREDFGEFRDMVKKFRQGMNRVRAMSKLSRGVEQFAAENKQRFSEEDLASIESNLAVIAQKRQQLRRIYRRTVQNVRETFRELRAFRDEMRDLRKGRG
ncbi:FecR domain-containing protein [Thermodesulfobacteriota bacterium]